MPTSRGGGGRQPLSPRTFANGEHDEERVDQAGPDQSIPGVFERQKPTDPYDKFMPSAILTHEKNTSNKALHHDAPHFASSPPPDDTRDFITLPVAFPAASARGF